MKSGRPFLSNFLLFAFLTAFVFILYIIQKLEIESAKREMVILQDSLSARNNIVLQLEVEVQKLISEDRITGIASEKLGLIREKHFNEIIKIDKRRVIISEQYLKELYGL